jgi:hypothetical protein
LETASEGLPDKPLAKRRRTPHNASRCRESSMDPDVRISRRLDSVYSMRGFSSSLLRWVTVAACGSRRIYFRPKEMEFPMAWQNACSLLERPDRGHRAAGCASIDALRLCYNSATIKDQHEISSIRETSATFARRLSPKRRSPFAFSRYASASSQKNILAANRGIFR